MACGVTGELSLSDGACWTAEDASSQAGYDVASLDAGTFLVGAPGTSAYKEHGGAAYIVDGASGRSLSGADASGRGFMSAILPELWEVLYG